MAKAYDQKNSIRLVVTARTDEEPDISTRLILGYMQYCVSTWAKYWSNPALVLEVSGRNADAKRTIS